MIFIAAIAIETVAMATFVVATVAMAVLTMTTVAMATVAMPPPPSFSRFLYAEAAAARSFYNIEG